MSMTDLFANELKKISPIYINRASDYADAVDFISYTKSNHSIKFKFEVEGTEVYIVQILVFGDEISCMCTCPCYAENDECKHIVACLQYLVNHTEIYNSLATQQSNKLLTPEKIENDPYEEMIANYTKIKMGRFLKQDGDCVFIFYDKLQTFIKTASNKIYASKNYEAGIKILKYILSNPPIVDVRQYIDHASIQLIGFE
jgi:hypothetical protein